MSTIPYPLLYVPHESTDVFWNFGLESYFAEEKRLPDRCVFLLWRTTPTLMAGRYQNILAEINGDYAREARITVVRRKSGGGCIYTDLGGWQFSFILPDPDKQIDFQRFTAPILAALNGMGIPASFNGRNDLVVDGRKFSGNAQYRAGGFTVHHGSILFASNIEEMVRSTTVADYKMLSKGIASVRERVSNLASWLPAGTSALAFRDRLAAALKSPGIEDYRLSDAEIDHIREIGQREYADPAIIWGLNPPFSLELSGHFSGGHVQLSLNVENGLIRDASLQGDFFAEFSEADFAAALRGVPYGRESVAAALRAQGIEARLYQITAEDLASLLP